MLAFNVAKYHVRLRKTPDHILGFIQRQIHPDFS